VEEAGRADFMLAGLPTAPGEKERERDNGFQHLRAMADLCRKWTARGKGSIRRAPLCFSMPNPSRNYSFFAATESWIRGHTEKRPR